MKVVHFLASVFAFAMLSGCSASLSGAWDDDYSKLGAQRGGTVTYLNQGADFVIEKRKNDAVQKARKYCAGRPVFFVDERNTVSESQGTVAVQNKAQHSGTVTSGYQSADYSGTTTYTTYQPVTYTWNHGHATFICGDADADAGWPVYIFRTGNAGDPAVCRAVDDTVRPGPRRLKMMATADGSDDCVDRAGWLRQVTEDRKVHIFVGEKGKALCRSLEEEMVQGGVKGEEANLFLRKRLSCGGAALTH